MTLRARTLQTCVYRIGMLGELMCAAVSRFVTGLLLGVALLSGCGTDHPSGTGSSHSATPATPVDLTGAWKQTNSDSKDAWQAATITGNVIEINWITDGGDTKSLYWVGSYVAPTKPGSHFTWVSKRDRAKTENALLASTSDTKTFTFSGGELRWETSILGTTMTIRAKKN